MIDKLNELTLINRLKNKSLIHKKTFFVYTSHF